ncbi:MULTISPECIES: hypothetical protein [Tenacibaculum]|uniref:hypothetical protein n=1 Tax=Tenacibaculum TaxID=104267 RepID=UPI00089422D4|nr:MULTISPECIES: hypothetical protein [unclassified Tenacibaculum]RBW59670.1 hypothetical protein DS884_08015 [Tenacibaculum sp. E3R01]SED95474.1 hypothetical protein SAMN04487765_0909 [Tenacibaculum sp. MAR_2010_89]
MRKFVLLVFVALMNVSAFAINENPVKEEIRTNIVKLLGKVDFTIEKDVKTTIDFLVNKKGEVVILDVDCASPEVCAYIKSKLNYKRVYKNIKKSVQIYKMPLKIVRS